MASIRPLPEAVRSSVRSGIFLFDLTRVVEELIYNSLDARATKVSVFVSVGSCYLKVVDDGGGITRDGLELVGERYATSKFLNLDDLNATNGNFGFRGEALASISEVSLLEIVTRAYGRPNGYRKVLKGCKCLYLRIDDDRKEVGTTVVVRELFYNQPVRRKYMQSSPKKVLQSIKKCIMRLALVRPNISFKVVDIEREDELFCTHSASSPLSLVTSGFGVEVTSSLHELELENDIIKLSGYISGPCNTFNMKALQYLYINSQFICKGPIHKLLSQLAIRFEHLNSWNTDNECQNKKRSRTQPCPAYILNLRCPRSLYVLSFEPSKTCVEFKDWAPILNFIEKAIKQFWEGSIASGDSSNQATHMVQEDRPGIADADVNIISAEADISKFGNQNRKDCLDLFFSTSDKLTEDDYHHSNREDVKSSLGYLHQGTAMSKEQQKIGGNFQKPFLKSCSTQEGSILHEKALLVNDEHELQTDSFWSKQNLGEDCRSGKDLCARPCLEVTKKLKISKDSDFLVRAWSEENCLPPDSCYSAAQIGSSGSDDQLSNSEWHPVYQEPSSQATAFGVYHTNDINDLGGVSRRGKRIHCSQIFDDEENRCNFSYNLSRNASQHHCTSSFANSGFNFDGAVDCNKIFDRSVDWPDFSDIYFTKRSDILNEEPDWLLPESCVRNCKRHNTNKGKRDHFRHPALEKNHERSKRSFSAPPFHRSKRRFLSLNQPPEMIAKRPTGQASNPAFNPLEASDFKYSPHSPGALYPSNEDLLQKFKTNVKHSSEVLGDPQVNDITEIDAFGSFKVQQNDPFRELISREVQDSIDYGNKWRNCSPQIPVMLSIFRDLLHCIGDIH